MLVSFDIDGTLEVGDPAGPVPLDLVRRAQQSGYVIGSCSDRTQREQTELWERAGIDADFVCAKYALPQIKDRFGCLRYVHIGDTTVDTYYAGEAGFEPLLVADFHPASLERALGLAAGISGPSGLGSKAS